MGVDSGTIKIYGGKTQKEFKQDFKGGKAMREIKFRAWDIENKKMLSPEITESLMSLYGWSQRVFLWLQYTGLEDKNGWEIYEGDIVEVQNGDCGKVIFDCARFRLNCWFRRDKKPVYFKNRDKKPIYFKKYDWFSAEVIGNIYENPELLEAKP